MRSIRHQHRKRRVTDDVAGRTAEDQLAKPALGVGAFDQEVAVERLRGGEHRFTGAAASEIDGAAICSVVPDVVHSLRNCFRKYFRFEPFLLQQGFIQRTPRGRLACAKAYLHLGLPAPTQPPVVQPGLFEEEG